jgi:hypothetical protein
MSIATRKAGTVVRCTKCAGEIIVPPPEGAMPPEPEQSPGEAFEKADFDVKLHGATTPAAPPPPAPSPPQPQPEPPRPLGIFLPLGTLLISIGVIVVLLVLMFVLGLMLGQGQHAAPPEPKTSSLAADYNHV